MYDLVVDGVADFYTRRPNSKRFMRRQPLVGLVNGTNKVFLLPNYPVMSTGTVLYSNGTVINPAGYTLDADGGAITFSTAPTVQPTADYYAVALTNQQIVYYVWAGYQLMESLWARGYLLSNSDTAYAQAAPTDTHIYLCALDVNNAPGDPIIGSLTFSASFIQRNWLARCTELAFLDSMLIESSLADVNIAERVGGIRVQTDHRAKSIQESKNLLRNEMVTAMYAALDEWSPSGTHYGGTLATPHTTYYETTWQWQTDGQFLVPYGVIG